MKRLEQQVQPNLNTPAGLYPSAGPIHVSTAPLPTPDLNEVTRAMNNLGALTAKLGAYRKEAQNEADELAMIDFNGKRAALEKELLAAYSTQDLNAQSESIPGFAQDLTDKLTEVADGLPLSPRRREVVRHLIESYGEQFKANLGLESTRNLERYNIAALKNHFNEARNSGNVETTRDIYRKMVARGIAPGTTEAQAVSRAASVSLVNYLGTLGAEQLAYNIEDYRQHLGTDANEFPVEGDAKISRTDLAKVLSAAKTMQRERRAENYSAIQQLKANGELDQNKLDEMLKTGAIDASQHRVCSRELDEEARQLRRTTYGEIHDRIYELLTEYETDPQSEELNLQLTEIVGQVDGLRQEGKLEITHANTLRNLVDSFYKKADKAEKERARLEADRLKTEDDETAFRREIMLGGIEDRLRALEFPPGADEYSPQYLGLRDEIMNNDKLTGKERTKLLNVLAKRVKGVWGTKDGHDVDEWLRGEFIRKTKDKDGRTTNEYRNLGYATGWFDGEKAVEDQEFQRQRYEEIRNYAGKLISEGKTPIQVQDACRELVKKLNAAELPDNAKRFVIEAVKPARDSAEAAGVRQLAGMLPVDRKTRSALDIEAKTKGKTVARTGTLNGRRIVQYTDKSVEVTMPDGTVKLGKLTPGGGIEFPDEVKK